VSVVSTLISKEINHVDVDVDVEPINVEEIEIESQSIFHIKALHKIVNEIFSR